MVAILELYFPFRRGPYRILGHVILLWCTKFRQNPVTHCGTMTSYVFLIWWPSAILDLYWTMLHPRTIIGDLKSILKSQFDLMYRFGDIVTFVCWRFGWKLPIQLQFWGVFSQMPSLIVLTPKGHLYMETCRLSHKAWKSVQRFDLSSANATTLVIHSIL